VDVVENAGRSAEWIWSRMWEKRKTRKKPRISKPVIPHTILEGHLLFVGDFEAFDRTMYGQISPRALLPPPGTERGVDMVENVRRAKTRKKPRTSKPGIENKKQHDRNAGQKRQLALEEPQRYQRQKDDWS
jgi:hypothetical protein